MSLLQIAAIVAGGCVMAAVMAVMACVRVAGLSSRREEMLLDERDSSHDSARLGTRE